MDSDEDEEMEYGDEEDDGEVAPEDKPRVLIKYFPILRDLVEQARLACRCFYCSREKGQQTFMWDENCLESQAFMEVMFYFSQGIADAFGAPDVSGYSQGRAVDAATIDILFEAIESVRFNPSNLEGRIEWHTLLNTACQIFLGCDQLDSMTDTINHNDTPDTPEPNITKSLGTTIIAVQHGNLAVVAPWLDLSQKIELRRCFRWQVVQGRLSLPVGEVSGKIILQEVAHDTSVIETQHTEDVSDYAEMFKMPTYPAGAEIQLTKDNSDESCDFVLVSAAGKMSHKLLMRVTSEAHSRMVDPSRTIIKMARGIHALQCKHDKSKTGSVPEDRTVEMYRFDELLGRWGALEGREGDPEEQRDLSSSMESLASPPTLTTDGGKSAKSSQPSKSLRVTHILNSSFKFNTALALSEDNPAFVGSGNVCLDCALGKAIGFELQDLNKDYSRWIINHDPHLSNKVPRNRFQLTQSQPRLIAHDKPSVVRNPSNLSPILVSLCSLPISPFTEPHCIHLDTISLCRSFLLT
jgi:hypothetical protein